jgi:hypothetical protein
MRQRRRDPFQAIADALPQEVRPVEIELIHLSINSRRVGMSSPSCKYPDEIVAKAREMKAAGMTYKKVGMLLGVPWSTVQKWVGRCAGNAKRVTPAARIIARRKA